MLIVGWVYKRVLPLALCNCLSASQLQITSPYPLKTSSTRLSQRTLGTRLVPTTKLAIDHRLWTQPIPSCSHDEYHFYLHLSLCYPFHHSPRLLCIIPESGYTSQSSCWRLSAKHNKECLPAAHFEQGGLGRTYTCPVSGFCPFLLFHRFSSYFLEWYIRSQPPWRLTLIWTSPSMGPNCGTYSTPKRRIETDVMKMYASGQPSHIGPKLRLLKLVLSA
jgi:hypothetical protein